jgi:hypothetical protein
MTPTADVVVEYNWRCACGSDNCVVTIEDPELPEPSPGATFLPQCPVCGGRPARTGTLRRGGERIENMRQADFEVLLAERAVVHPRRTSKEVADAFVEEQWRPIATAAWRNYQRNGRGALLIHWRWIERWAEGTAFNFAPQYVTHFDTPIIDGMIRTYDPRASVIVAFTTDEEATAGDDLPPGSEAAGGARTLRPGDELLAWIFAFQPPPPQIHRESAN